MTEGASLEGILIVGGYGQVGRAISSWLAPRFPDRVVVAGRDLERAESTAAQIGFGVRARAFDVTAPAQARTLAGIGLVVVCLDQQDTAFVEECLARGIHYVDISAEYSFLRRVDELDDLATANGATVVLSVGVAPGLTNMLAARVCESSPGTNRVDILLELGLGDHHGRAALAWMFDNLDVEYSVREDGRMKAVRSLGERIRAQMPGRPGVRSAYRFNLSDQHVLARTLGVDSVSTWIRLDSPFATWLLAAGSRLGLGRLLRWRWLRQLTLWIFMNVHVGSDVCAVAVRGTREGADATIGLVGHREAQMTAVVAAETVRQVLTTGPSPGVFHSDQLLDLDLVISALERDAPDLVVRL